MTAGILNPTDKARSTVSRPARTALGDAVRKWYQAGIFPNAQDFNDLIAQLRAAGDAFGVPDAEGDDEYLLKMLRAAGREKLTSPRTYYVRSDGSDSNDGLSDTAGGAFLTVQKAINTVWNLNLNGQAVVIQSRLATCAEALVFNGPNIGNNTTGALVTLRGDTTTPSNRVIQPASGSCITAISGAVIIVEGFKLVAPVYGLSANRADITISGACEFGACTTAHMSAQIGGRITRSANITVSGASARHVRVSMGGSYEGAAGTTVTISGAPDFSTALVEMNRNGTYSESTVSPYSGTATGFKFLIDSDCSLRGHATIVSMNEVLPGSKLGVVRPVETAPLQPMRNLLINGDGQLQNGPSGAVGDDVYGLHDRWYVLSQSGNVTPSTVRDVVNGTPNVIRLTNSHGSAQRVGYAQIIGKDVASRFRGKRLAAHVRARASGSLALRVSILSWSGAADIVTSDVVSSWTNTSFTVGGFFVDTAGLSVLLSTAVSLGADPSTLIDFTNAAWVADVPSDCNNLILLVHSNGTLGSAGTMDFRVQLEEGLVASPFDLRAPHVERLLARRRIQRKTVNSINGTIFVPLDEMAATPTLAIVSGAGSVANATKDGFHLTHTSVASHDILCTAEL